MCIKYYMLSHTYFFFSQVVKSTLKNIWQRLLIGSFNIWKLKQKRVQFCRIYFLCSRWMFLLLGSRWWGTKQGNKFFDFHVYCSKISYILSAKHYSGVIWASFYRLWTGNLGTKTNDLYTYQCQYKI